MWTKWPSISLFSFSLRAAEEETHLYYGSLRLGHHFKETLLHISTQHSKPTGWYSHFIPVSMGRYLLLYLIPELETGPFSEQCYLFMSQGIENTCPYLFKWNSRFEEYLFQFGVHFLATPSFTTPLYHQMNWQSTVNRTGWGWNRVWSCNNAKGTTSVDGSELNQNTRSAVSDRGSVAGYGQPQQTIWPGQAKEEQRTWICMRLCLCGSVVPSTLKSKPQTGRMGPCPRPTVRPQVVVQGGPKLSAILLLLRLFFLGGFCVILILVGWSAFFAERSNWNGYVEVATADRIIKAEWVRR